LTIKVSEYFARYLTQRGVGDVFLVSGGGIMHLLDAIGSQPGLRYLSTYHEQAAVVAAEGYARTSGKIGVALATVGPGAANAVSGLPGAWVDSIPLLVITGQVRRDLIADYAVARQYGPQEANTLDMARPVTKYAARVDDPNAIRKHLELAFHHALHGRPGPVWLEIPLDVQGATVDENELPGAGIRDEPLDRVRLRSEAQHVAELLRTARRPLVVGGNGVRSGGAVPLLQELLERFDLPIVMPITAKDLVSDDDVHCIGIFGTAGQRRANFAVQNADLLLTLGAGLNVQKCGFNVAGFASNAVKVVVDIDPVQLEHQALKPDVAILADVYPFLAELLAALAVSPPAPQPRWRDACAAWKSRYPVITDDYRRNPANVNSYLFMDALSDAVEAEDTIVPGAGLDTVSTYQALRVARGQRVLISGWGSMGWDLPLSIGACIASGRRTITVTGDGSIQWNIQELMTIAYNRLPVKIFIFNNAGFASIRATQTAFFEGRFVGADRGSGVAAPDFAQLARAYGLPFVRIARADDLTDGVRRFLADDAAGICEVMLAPEQGISPKASAFRRADGTFESRPLEDMAPFLPREEVRANMHQFDEQPASA
jgi:acetolactate synthase-1/2/3 large subunit